MPLFIFVYIFLEIFVLVQASSLLGGWVVLGLLALSFLAGSYLLKYIRSAALLGRVTSVPRLILTSFAGVLLIVPGFVSDIMAILLLIPQVQNGLFRRTGNYFANQAGFTRVFRFDPFAGAGQGGFSSSRQEPEFRSEVKVTVIDSETGGKSEQQMKNRRKIDESSIIDVDSKDDSKVDSMVDSKND